MRHHKSPRTEEGNAPVRVDLTKMDDAIEEASNLERDTVETATTEASQKQEGVHIVPDDDDNLLPPGAQPFIQVPRLGVGNFVKITDKGTQDTNIAILTPSFFWMTSRSA